MNPTTKKILLSFALIAAILIVIAANAGCLNYGATPEGGHFYSVMGILNGCAEVYLLVRLVVKYMKDGKL